MTGKQLKNSILQWAIQGKLVPQDPNDEPASVLLERIRAEKARLIKEGKIKKDKNETIIYRGDDNSHYEKLPNGEVRCIDNEIPFEIPESWCWVRLRNYAEIIGGYAFPSAELKAEKGLRVIRISDISEEGFVNKSIVRYNAPDQLENYKIVTDDILIAMTGGTVGKSLYVESMSEDMLLNQRVAIIRNKWFNIKYIDCVIKSPHIKEFINSRKNSTNDNISMVDIANFLIPVPPLNEQQKIVEKFQAILQSIEKYRKSQEQLNILNASLYTNLKKSILQDAIQGKLVNQNREDEPASVLLERIQEEKKKLVKEGVLKKKDLVETHIFKGDDNKYYEQIGKSIVCIDAEIPFEIPSSWCWCRLETLVTILDGYRKPISKAERKSGIYPYYGANGILDYVDDYILDGEFLLVGEDGSVVTPYGSPVVNKASGKIWVNNHAHVLQECGKLGYYEYLFYALSTIKITQYIHGFMPKYSQGDLRKTLIPIPPIAEQHRIVVKIEESCGSL